VPVSHEARYRGALSLRLEGWLGDHEAMWKIVSARLFVVSSSPPWRVDVEWEETGSVAHDPHRQAGEGTQYRSKGEAVNEAFVRASRYADAKVVVEG
jgi:hypothetical protein